MTQKQIHIFADDADKETLQQFKNCYSQKFVTAAALMPDAHQGYVAPIGAVLATKDHVVPSWVGYDIGCGMTAVKIKGKKFLKLISENRQKIYNQVKRDVPMGLGEINKPNALTSETKKQYEFLLKQFQKDLYDKQVLDFLTSGKAERHLGTLGSGNHFISLNKDEKDYAWIVVHSGSRGIGHWAAKLYMKKSAMLKKGDNAERTLVPFKFEETFPLETSSELGKEYLNLLDFGLEFALLNRMEIIRKIISSLEKVLGEKIKWEVWVNKNHNHAIKEKGLWIHRKGATPAKKSERGVIPANMRDGSFLVEGKGNRDFLESSSHGAGRRLSRTQAKQEISLEELKTEMKNIVSEINHRVLDEAPKAYKDIHKVLNAQKQSIKIISHLKPIINWQT